MGVDVERNKRIIAYWVHNEIATDILRERYYHFIFKMSVILSVSRLKWLACWKKPCKLMDFSTTINIEHFILIFEIFVSLLKVVINTEHSWTLGIHVILRIDNTIPRILNPFYSKPSNVLHEDFSLYISLLLDACEPHTVEILNSCTSRPNVYQCLVVQHPWTTCQKTSQAQQWPTLLANQSYVQLWCLGRVVATILRKLGGNQACGRVLCPGCPRI